ncbi:MAG TPA: DUF2652 domain-containing protein [Candidatus Limnocylindrales bacterium]|nr:DUF2652 domain-containing protein [Candidatus Limnocylindrales bacterium]
MPATPESGLLVLADLTGYTAYLTRSELEHAPTIAGDLLDTIVARLEPPFRLAKLEGDAAFLFAEDGRAEPALLADALEAAYLAFRRRLRSIAAGSACTCNACGLAPQLDLKLFVHHGTWVRTAIAGRDELAGADVILVHRLLKADLGAAAGGHAFAFLTDPAVSALGLDPGAGPLERIVAAPDGFGPLPGMLLDLDARWRLDAERVRIDPARPVLDMTLVIAASPMVVWDHLTLASLRARWEGDVRLQAVDGDGGPGSLAHCVTGRLAMLEEVVDWQPFERVGWRVVVPGAGRAAVVADLTPEAGGTRLRVRWAPEGAGDRAVLRGIAAARGHALAGLKHRLEAGAVDSRETAPSAAAG